MKTIEQLQRVLDPALVTAKGAVRRMAISLTSRVLWQLTGFRLPGAGGSTTTETQTAEPFTGIGFYARPPTSGKPEAIVIMVNDGQNPVVVAVRDEKTRAAIAGALEANETAVFNSAAIVHVKADGTIEARSASGVAVPLATLADVQAMRSTYNGHQHLETGGTTNVTTSLMAAPTGTTVLKGE